MILKVAVVIACAALGLDRSMPRLIQAMCWAIICIVLLVLLSSEAAK